MKSHEPPRPPPSIPRDVASRLARAASGSRSEPREASGSLRDRRELVGTAPALVLDGDLFRVDEDVDVDTRGRPRHRTVDGDRRRQERDREHDLVLLQAVEGVADLDALPVYRRLRIERDPLRHCTASWILRNVAAYVGRRGGCWFRPLTKPFELNAARCPRYPVAWVPAMVSSAASRSSSSTPRRTLRNRAPAAFSLAQSISISRSRTSTACWNVIVRVS